MSYSSTGTSFFHNNWLEGEVVGSKPITCMCNLPIKKEIHDLILDACLFYLLKRKIILDACVKLHNLMMLIY